MVQCYPTPRQLGISIPRHLREDRFNQGFVHALRGGQLTEPEFFRLSFREGFRCAKRYLRHVRRQRGIVEFPQRGRIKFKAV